MKKPTLMRSLEFLCRGRVVAAALSAAALLLPATTARAADDITIDTFDSAASAAQWTRWWGGAPQLYEWDGTVDADGNAGSGSLKVTVDFNLASYGGDNQFAAIRGMGGVDGSQYTNLVFDLKWDQSSPRRAQDFGYFEPGFRNSDYSQNWLSPFNVSTNEGWLHIVLPINPTAPKIETINGVVLKMWAGANPGGFTGKTIFWVDNVKLIARPNTGAPPPTMEIEKAKPGLKMFASAPGAQYQRQNIRTKNPQYSWVGATDPVTYSLTISDYPSTTHSSFQTHLFLVPGTGIPNYETSVDWNQPNIIFLQIGQNTDGSAFAVFRYKTNQPSGNAMLYGAGSIATVGSSTVRGTWNLTFNPDGQISLASPSGGITNFTMPPEAVSLFGGPLYAYFGVQPNQLSAIGQAAVIHGFQITGVANPISQEFLASSLDTDTWEKVADDQTGIIPVGQDALFWINWTLPDRDFTLQYQDDLVSPTTWGPMVGTPIQIGDRRRFLLHGGNQPQSLTGNMFFKLLKP